MAKSKNTVKVKVVGSNAVAGVYAPGEVELDPEVTNIPALVSAGHVQLLEKLPDDQDAPQTSGDKTPRRAPKDKD